MADRRPRIDAPRRRLNDGRLQRRHRRGDHRAHAELTERYLPLARRLALRYRDSGEPVDDLIQVASLGLVKALERWDPDRGIAFSTYATPTILGELRRHFRDTTWAVRPPRRTQELALIVGKVRDGLGQRHSRSVTPADIAGALGRSQEDVRDALEAAGARQAVSLDAPVVDADGETRTRLDVIREPEMGYERVDDALLLDGLMAILDERAREVVRLRFHEELLQREIAERVGCSQMQVSRILGDSLSTLRFYAGARARQPDLELAAAA